MRPKKTDMEARMIDLPNSVQARDIAYLLHPNTNARKHEKTGPIVIDRGEGIYVYDDQGREYIEAMSGLWSVAVGFGERRLVDAATRQLNKLPYYHSFSSKSTGPAVDLAERLVKISPSGLDRVFFTNSGSEANDTIVKLVWFYNNAIGRPEKKKFIARMGGYHGVTLASASLTGLSANHQGFDLPLSMVKHLTCPYYYRFAQVGETEEEFSDRLAAEFESMIVAEGPETVAAFIGEPVIGAGGVLTPPATYWEKMQKVCRKYDVLLVIDEVISGFGRLGSMFACDHYGISPDILTLSKQITSSYVPLAAVLISDEFYQGIADGTDKLGVLGHGFTGGGHPVAAAVANENLNIIEERKLVENAATVGAHMQALLRQFTSHPLVGEVRGLGLIAGVELVANKASKEKFDPPGRVGQFLYNRGHENGLIIRNVQDTICFCPPLIISHEQVDEMVSRFARCLEETSDWIEAGMPS
jgi:4-aminobutyrate---pyruvate transaminase